MHALIAWSGFLGAWLLVAGPLFQAAVDLDGTQEAREDIVKAGERVGPRPRISPWWWLLPPVAYVKLRLRRRDYQQLVFDALDRGEVETFVDFSNVSTGWAMVALGAFFIAIKETYEVVEIYEWPTWVLPVGVVLMIVLCAFNTVTRINRAHHMLSEAERHQADAPTAA